MSAKHMVYARLVGKTHAHAERDAPAHQHSQVLCASCEPRAQQKCRSGDLHACTTTQCIAGAIYWPARLPQTASKGQGCHLLYMLGGQPCMSLSA